VLAGTFVQLSARGRIQPLRCTANAPRHPNPC
jgi:hypothetical protein